MVKELKGSAKVTHSLKEYGNGQSMKKGIQRLMIESREAGQREGFQQGVQFALQRMTLLQRLFGGKIRRSL